MNKFNSTQSYLILLLVPVFFCFLFLTCTPNEQIHNGPQFIVPDGYVKHSILLEQSGCLLSFYVPDQFDTTYCWEYDYYLWKTRLANKSYSLQKEVAGLFGLPGVPDSLLQVTIREAKYDSIFSDWNIEEAEEALKTSVEKQITMFPESMFHFKEVREINDRLYVILAVEYCGWNELIEYSYICFTNIGRFFILIEFKCNANNCGEYIERMEKSLYTIIIE